MPKGMELDFPHYDRPKSRVFEYRILEKLRVFLTNRWRKRNEVMENCITRNVMILNHSQDIIMLSSLTKMRWE
jgi:hypothetical protein